MIIYEILMLLIFEIILYYINFLMQLVGMIFTVAKSVAKISKKWGRTSGNHKDSQGTDLMNISIWL